jgi:hypothetical protein
VSRPSNSGMNVLGVVLALIVVWMLTLVLLPAVNLAGRAPAVPETPAKPPVLIDTPAGKAPVELVTAGVTVGLIGGLVVLGFVLGLGSRALEGIAKRAGAPSAPPAPAAGGAPAAKGAKAAAAPAAPARKLLPLGRAGSVVAVLGLAAAAFIVYQIALSPIWNVAVSLPGSPQGLPNIAALGLVLVVVLVIVLVVTGAIVLGVVLLDRSTSKK